MIWWCGSLTYNLTQVVTGCHRLPLQQVSSALQQRHPEVCPAKSESSKKMNESDESDDKISCFFFRSMKINGDLKNHRKIILASRCPIDSSDPTFEQKSLGSSCWQSARKTRAVSYLNFRNLCPKFSNENLFLITKTVTYLCICTCIYIYIYVNLFWEFTNILIYALGLSLGSQRIRQAPPVHFAVRIQGRCLQA